MSRSLLNSVLAVALIFITLSANAQITVTNQSNANILAQKIIGTGVTLLNPQFKGNGLQAGIFRKTGTSNFPLDSGIVLTTGSAKTGGGFFGIDGPASSFASRGHNGVGDADLAYYCSPNGIPLETEDACVLEFDFIPQGDSIYIRYIFASEEYPEYNCGTVNDAFGFLISGPGYFGKKIISLLPETVGNQAVAVAINTVNSGIITIGNIANCLAYGGIGSPYTQYYVDNSASTHMIYDGRTVVFTAKAKVVPCQTYHIKLGITDVGDDIWDSGVFIEANGFTTKKEINTQEQGPYTDPQNNDNVTMIEACKTAQVKVTRAEGITGAFSLSSTYAGTATPNVDFTTDMPATISFAANENEKIYNFTATADALNEPLEKLIVRFSKGTCATVFVDSAILYIRDSLLYRSRTDTSFCTSTPITLTAHNPEASVTNTYLWSQGSTTQSITVNQPGMYVARHFYSERCVNLDSFNVVSNDPSWTFDDTDISICPGDTATLSLTTDANTITWSNGATTNSIKVTAAGPYWVSGANAKCAKSDTVNVLMKPVPYAELGKDTGFCENKTLELDASYPGATHQWSTGATTPTITVSTDGEYWVINTLNGCTAKDTIEVTVNPIPAIELGKDTSFCEGGSIQLNATYAGATHQWSNGATTATITVSATGEYRVTNDLNGCIAKDTINITSKPLPALELGADRSVCEQDTIHLHAFHPGATYSWNTGATTATIIASTAGKYTVVSTLDGCSAKDSMTLALDPIPVVNLGSDTSICENKTLVLNAAYPGATTYSWNTGATTATLTVNTPGRYIVINSLNGCTDTDTIDVDTDPIPVLELGADRSMCDKETTQLDATYPGATYLWSNGATTPTIIVANGGKYTVTSTMNNCSAIDSVNVEVKPIPVVNLGKDTGFCENTFIILDASFPGGTSHSWSNGATTPTITVTMAGEYRVVNTLNGCVARDTINIDTKSAPLLDLGADTSMCEYDEIPLSAHYPGATYQWSTGSGADSIIVTTAGKYSVISTLSGCPAYDTIIIESKKMPVVNAGMDMVISQNTSAQLSASQHSNNATYLWSPAATLSNPAIANPVATPTAPLTEYTVYVVSVDGCVDEDKVAVRVVYPISIPNAFSPNGDGINDTWRITNIELYPRSRVYIFNRYGQQVYNQGGFAGPWDGSYKGKTLQPSTYYYIIDVGDGQKHTGYVVLLR